MSAIALYARPSQAFESRVARSRELLIEASLAHARPGSGPARIQQASSLGVEDMVVSHLIHSLGLPIPIFVLETGRLHVQTLALLDKLRAWPDTVVHVYRPQAEPLAAFEQSEGPDPMYRSVALRKACCQIRKLEPLSRALDGLDAWITGLRREQSDHRADVPEVDRSDTSRTKYNPLADWSWGDVWAYVQRHGVAYNPLHDEFYPSIGCQPCTRAIAVGEDFRAGRWWWENQDLKECGLHTRSTEP